MDFQPNNYGDKDYLFTYKIKEEFCRAVHPLNKDSAGHKGHEVIGRGCVGILEVDDPRRVHVRGVEGDPVLVPVLTLQVPSRSYPGGRVG